ncbi:MAG: uroporphyrinogen-III synthase [Sphingomonadaceae bacterium]|nr:uroporphyrinogen-III synthase [Sphingomonadaceae bacterium]
MTERLIVLRPEPGASATAERAISAGWDAVTAPLFTIVRRGWSPPDPAGFDALMVTSSNAMRHGGAALARYRDLPLYAVGEASADAARGAGIGDIRTNGPDVAALADSLRADGRHSVLHLAGEDVRAFDERGLAVTRVAVYAAEPAEPDGLSGALAEPAIALLHSPRAAARFAEYCDGHAIDRAAIAIAAISPAALHEAGGGWRSAVVAEKPGDAALLDAAAKLA